MKFIIAGTAIFLWGLFMFLKPVKFWGLFESWKNANNATPSKNYLVQIRISGCICMVVGLALFVGSFFADRPI